MKKEVLMGALIFFIPSIFAMEYEGMNLEEPSAILGKRGRETEQLFAQEKKQKLVSEKVVPDSASDPMSVEQPVQTTANSFIKLIKDADPREVETVRPIPFSSCLLCMYQSSFIL